MIDREPEQVDSTTPFAPEHLLRSLHGNVDRARATWLGARAKKEHEQGGLANRFVFDWKGELIFVAGLGWHAWGGGAWGADHDGEALRCMKLTVGRIMLEEHSIVAVGDDDREKAVKALRAFAAKMNTAREMRGALDLASVDAKWVISVDALDTDPWLLSTAAGTIDLRTGAVSEHRREDLITRIANVDYAPDAGAPRWEAFLERILPDPELRAFVQRAAGYSLTGSVREHALFVCHGDGRNGKSTFLEAIAAAAGQHALQTPPSTLLERRSDIPNDVARLRGARLVTSNESGDGQALDEARVKALTGGDRIVARYMRGEWFEFTATFKLWLATNARPKIRGTDEGIWRRIHLIPFEITIPDAERDLGLGDHIRAHELPGVLAWMVRGAREYVDNGMRPPDAVRAATAGYRAEQDPLADFLEERCERDGSLKCTTDALYSAYRRHAAEAGEPELTKKAFAQALRRHELTPAKVSGARGWTGVALRHVDRDGWDGSDGSSSFGPHARGRTHIRRDKDRSVRSVPSVPTATAEDGS